MAIVGKHPPKSKTLPGSRSQSCRYMGPRYSMMKSTSSNKSQILLVFGFPPKKHQESRTPTWVFMASQLTVLPVSDAFPQHGSGKRHGFQAPKTRLPGTHLEGLFNKNTPRTHDWREGRFAYFLLNGLNLKSIGSLDCQIGHLPQVSDETEHRIPALANCVMRR